MPVTVLHGDCLELLATLPDASIDACVTDPPYELGFMGKTWDGTGIAFNVSLWREVSRVLKPGAYLLSCGGTRTYHRMASAIEDAGFEIRDVLAWLYGSGFPKSLNLGDGLGTALKPAYEPIVLARKPFKGTVKGNVEAHGTGALNIDACRIGTGEDKGEWPITERRHADVAYTLQPVATDTSLGRWPANVCLDEIAALVLDEQSGITESNPNPNPNPNPNFKNNVYGRGMGGVISDANQHADIGGASRFYYVAKPSREERDYGCTHLKGRSSFETVSRDPGSAGANNPRAGSGRTSVLNTCEVVYNVAWVDAVLSRRLQADTETSRRRATVGSTTRSSDGSAWSMCWCGSPSTDPYHPVVRSIIETETSSITGSATSNSSRRPHTNGCMAAAFGVMAAGGNLAAYAEFQSPWKRLISTSPKKAGPSTADVDLATSIASWLTSAPVGGGQRVEAARNFHPT